MTQHITLLLAFTSDDAQENATILSRQLVQAGYQPAYTIVDSIMDVTRALSEEQWDMIAIDTGEYGISWQEAVGFVRSLIEDVPLLLLTGEPNEALAKDALSAGVDSVLLYGDWRTGAIVDQLLSLGKRRKEFGRQWQELREEERKYRGMVENSMMGIFNARPWMEITNVNPACASIFGFDSPADMLAFSRKHKGTLISPEDYTHAMRQLELEKQVVGLEIPAKKQDGSQIWVAISARPVLGKEGEVTAIEGTVEDVTNRKHMETMIIRAKQEWEKTFDNVPDIIVLLNNDLRLRRANRRLADMLGTHPRDIVGMPCKEIFGLTDMSDEMCQNVSNMQRGDLITQEMFLPALGGTYLVTLSPFFQDGDETTDPVGTVMVAHDVSRRIKLEAQLRQSQKMEAIGTLAGGIAHDFNNILGVMMGYTEMGMLEASQDSPMHRRLSEVLAAGRRARDLIHQILTFSRQDDLGKQSVNLAHTIDETTRLLRASIPADIAIVQNVQDVESTVYASPSQMHQVLMNLCTNAAHAMRHSGGILSIQLRTLVAGSQKVLFPNLADSPTGKFVHLTIADSGHGIASEKLESIFDPFFTTKGPDEGTGLGLALVHSIVTGAGGMVVVSSEEGQGTQFDIALPASVEGVEDVTMEMHVTDSGGGVALVVDDEEALGKVMCEMLEHLSYSTEFYAHPQEALAQFTQQPEAYSLLVTDQTMPDMTGAELVQAILAIRPDLPVILCTGYSERLSPEAAGDLGVAEYLFKPVMLQDITKAIENIEQSTQRAKG